MLCLCVYHVRGYMYLQGEGSAMVVPPEHITRFPLACSSHSRTTVIILESARNMRVNPYYCETWTLTWCQYLRVEVHVGALERVVRVRGTVLCNMPHVTSSLTVTQGHTAPSMDPRLGWGASTLYSRHVHVHVRQWDDVRGLDLARTLNQPKDRPTTMSCAP